MPATPTRPRLAYVVNALNPGGTEKLVIEMGLAFAREFDVEVVCLDEPGQWAALLRERGIPVHCVWRQPGLDLSMPGKLAALFRRSRVDIIHAHQCTPWFYAALSRLRHGAPRLLLEEHGRFYPEVRNRKRAFFNHHVIRRLTHAFVAVSGDIRKRLEAYEGLPARQVQVIYNGIAPPEKLPAAERAALRASFGAGPGDFLVGTVGRFDSIKNLPMLLSALARACESQPAVRGVLVGDGPMMAEVRARLDASGLAGRVHLTGYRSDAAKLTQCLDLFVLASFSEGTSMALLEAMAAGVPAAVTAVGGNPEIVLDGATGWTVPSGDVDALARVLAAAAGGARNADFAQAGRRRYAECFTAERMIANYRMLYGQLLGAR